MDVTNLYYALNTPINITNNKYNPFAVSKRTSCCPKLLKLSLELVWRIFMWKKKINKMLLSLTFVDLHWGVVCDNCHGWCVKEVLLYKIVVMAVFWKGSVPNICFMYWSASTHWDERFNLYFHLRKYTYTYIFQTFFSAVMSKQLNGNAINGMESRCVMYFKLF